MRVPFQSHRHSGLPRRHKTVGIVLSVLLSWILASPCGADVLKERVTFPEQGVGVWSMTLSPDGKTLVMGLQNGTIKLWDTLTANPKSVLGSHAHGVVALAFTPDGKTLASGSRDKTLKLWDVRTGRNTATWVPRAEDANKPLDFSAQSMFNDVSCLAFSPDGKLLASGSTDKAIRLWEVATGKKVATLQGHAEKVHSLSFSPDGTFLASAGGDIKLWDVASRKVKVTLKGLVDPLILAYISGLVLFDEVINKVWKSVTGTPMVKLDLADLPEAGRSVAFSPDGKTLAVGGYRIVSLWDVSRGKYLASLSGFKGPVESIAFSSNGKLLAAGGARQGDVEDGLEQSEVRLLDLTTGQCLAAHRHRPSLHSVVFSPEGKTLASGACLAVKVWDVGERSAR